MKHAPNTFHEWRGPIAAAVCVYLLLEVAKWVDAGAAYFVAGLIIGAGLALLWKGDR